MKPKPHLPWLKYGIALAVTIAVIALLSNPDYRHDGIGLGVIAMFSALNYEYNSETDKLLDLTIRTDVETTETAMLLNFIRAGINRLTCLLVLAGGIFAYYVWK